MALDDPKRVLSLAAQAADQTRFRVLFEMLMFEKNLTRAGEKLFLGQPAVSAAQARLRDLFDDPLLVRIGTIDTTLLATDQQRSVLHVVKAKQMQQLIAYSPYGYRCAVNGLLSLLGFNGERSDPVTGHYLLGNGCRAFNPVLMRFNKPDTLSPFGSGGLNPYAYFLGDPVNEIDPTVTPHVRFLGRLPEPSMSGEQIDQSEK